MGILSKYINSAKLLTDTPRNLDRTLLIKTLKYREKLHLELLEEPENFCDRELEEIYNLDKWLIFNSNFAADFYRNLEEPWWELFNSNPHDQLDWLWKIIALASGTTAQAILLEFSVSFFAGNGGVTGVLLLLSQFGFGKLMINNFNKKGQKFAQRMMKIVRVPPHWHWEVRCLFSILFLMASLGVHFYAPELYANKLNKEGMQLIRERKLVDARSVFELSNSVFPENSRTLHNLGFIEEYLQNYDEAKNYYRGSIDYIYSLNNLAQIYIQEGEYDKAVQLLLYALQNKENSDIVQYFLYKNLAKARLGQKLPDEAIIYSKLALEHQSRAEVFCLLGDAYEIKNKPAIEIGFRQECLLRTLKKPELDNSRIKAKRRINEISKSFSE